MLQHQTGAAAIGEQELRGKSKTGDPYDLLAIASRSDHHGPVFPRFRRYVSRLKQLLYFLGFTRVCRPVSVAGAPVADAQAAGPVRVEQLTFTRLEQSRRDDQTGSRKLHFAGHTERDLITVLLRIWTPAPEPEFPFPNARLQRVR